MLENFRRNPLRKWNLPSNVSTGGRVLFMYLRNLSGGKSLRCSNQCRPKPAVNESDFSIYETANKHIFGIGYCFKDGENLMAPRMSPPASLNRLVDDGLG